MSACVWCGDEERLEVLEAWLADRAFILDTCCETLHDEAVEWLRTAPRKQVAAFLAGEIGCPVRQLVGKERGQLLLDFGLQLVPVSQRDAKAFVAAHHEHCSKPPHGWRFGFGLSNGRQLVAVLMAGRPVARRIDHTTTVEVNRLCVRRDIVEGLAWNACSMLYGAAAREARRRGFQHVITYTLESEAGDTLRAAGWQRTSTTKGGSWDRPSRRRVDAAPTCAKVRWEAP